MSGMLILYSLVLSGGIHPLFLIYMYFELRDHNEITGYYNLIFDCEQIYCLFECRGGGPIS